MLTHLFRMGDGVIIWLTALAVLSQGHAQLLLARTVAEGGPFVAGGCLAYCGLHGLGAYRFGPGETMARHLGRTLAAAAIAGGASLGLAALIGREVITPIEAWMVLLSLLLGLSHAFAWTRVRRWRKFGRLTPNVVVVGATENAARLIEAALARRDVAVLGIFDDRADRAPPTIHGVPVLGDTRHLLEHRILPYVDRIIITVTAASQPRVRELIERLRVLPNALTLFLDTDSEETRSATLSKLAETPLARVSGVEADERRAVAKRIQDVALGLACLIVAAPVMALIALAVRLDSPGPVLFSQRRHGFNNESITVWKFRSMRQESADASASRQVTADDRRITRVGRFIRSTSLDELPQLLNVLQGEMSLVGPRPHAIGMKTAGEESARLVAEYAWRHRMKPGITGWAQVQGSRGPVDTPEAVRRRVGYDIDYIERQSFWFDVYIILMTLPCLLGDRKTVR